MFLEINVVFGLKYGERNSFVLLGMVTLLYGITIATWSHSLAFGLMSDQAVK